MQYELIVKDLFDNQKRYSDTALRRGDDGIYTVLGQHNEYVAQITPHSLNGNTLAVYFMNHGAESTLSKTKITYVKRWFKKNMIPHTILVECNDEIGISFPKKHFIKVCSLIKARGRHTPRTKHLRSDT